MKIAVIDLGTNTFNLIIAQINKNQTFTTLYTDKQPAKIGEGGINQNIITPEAIQRAIAIINSYKDTITTKGGVDKIIGIATSAVRTAINQNQFIATIKKETEVSVNVISGEQEADFIYKGVKSAVPLNNEIVLILDIGGGSNEFIIANKEQVFWKQSFPLGIARIIEYFPPENPILPETIKKIETYFSKHLQPLWDEAKKYTLKTLIGASGSFDTYRMALIKNSDDLSLSFTVPIDEYFSLHQQLIRSTTEERLKIKGVDKMRVEMVVTASILTQFVIQKLGLTSMIQSEYSLREGALLYYAEQF